MYKRNDLTTDKTHVDYICYYEEMTESDYKFILDRIGKLENRVKAGFVKYTTQTGKEKARLLYTYKELHCAFDIETSTVQTVNIMNGITDYYSAMYVAQFAVDNIGIRFRMWAHVRAFFQDFPKRLKLAKNETIVVFVHNLDYETSYLKHRLNINGRTFFGKSRQKPIKYLAENHIYFHDSYTITNSSLEMLAKLYNTKHQKTKEDIDHTKERNFLTPITKREERYIFNDVFILTDFAKKLFDMYDFIPDTATQIIAKKIEKSAIERGAEMVGAETWERWTNDCTDDKQLLKRLHGYIFGYEYSVNGYKRKVKGLVDPAFFTPYNECGVVPPPDGIQESDGRIIYDFYTWLYRGGVAKSNARYTSTPATETEPAYLPYGVQCRVGGQDYTSSYPFVMTAFNYPISKFKEIDPETLNINSLNLWYDMPDFENYRYIFIIRFEKIRAINDMCIESVSKVKGKNIIGDNGRIYSADEITVCLTDCDYSLYRKFYTWEKKHVLKIWRAKAGKLPDFLLYPMWDDGRKKAELKHNDERKTEYNLAKAAFNTYYGLLCKQPVYQNYYFDNVVTGRDSYVSTESDVLNYFGKKRDIQHSVENMVENVHDCGTTQIEPQNFLDCVQSFILSPFWGIWVCAFARFNLLNMIYYIGQESDWITNDTIYCDTDSVYFKNPEKHQHLFNIWNEYARKRVLKRLPPEYHKALGTLGQFDNIAMDETHDFSDTFINFKTLGSKRYIKEMQFPKYKKIKATIAGLPVGSLENFCKRTKQDVYLQFNNFFDFSIESDDLTTQDRVKLGRKYHDEKMVFFVGGEKVVEYSSCTLYPTTFTLKMDKLYLSYMHAIHEKVQGGKYATYNVH